MLARRTSSLCPTRSGTDMRLEHAVGGLDGLVGVCATLSSSTANSSPPKRAAVSLARMTLSRRLANSGSTSSPAAWPSESLTVLKSSRSRNTTPTPPPSRSARADAWRTRSPNSARLARPVTGSWNAWWASCSSNCARSEMSRALRTMPLTCSSSSRFVYWISNCRTVPSRWRSAAWRTSVCAGLAGRPVAEDLDEPRAVAGRQQRLEAGAGELVGVEAEDRAATTGSGRRSCRRRRAR